MKKKFSALLLAALMVVSLLPMTVFAGYSGTSDGKSFTTPAPTVYIYLNTGGSSLWNKDGATFAVWTWGGSLSSDVAVPMELESDDIYKVDKSLLGESLLFVRVASGKTFNGEDWSNNTVWNQTGDLNVPSSGDNCYEITGWGAGNGQWTVHTPAAPTTYAITNCTTIDDKETNHGYISIDKTTAAESETVTITVNPEMGYQLKSLVVLSAISFAPPIIPGQDAQDETKYTFTMPDYPVTVTAVFEEKAITIADILPDDFPTFSWPLPDNVWKNSVGSKMYINNNGLTFGGVSLYNILSNPVTKDGNNYKYISDPYTITFVMDSGKLVKVITEGAENADNNGEYISSHTHSFTYTADNGKITATCTAGCNKGYDTTPLTLTLTAPASLVYDGNTKAFTFADGEESAWTAAGLELPIIFYHIKQIGQSTYMPLLGYLKSVGDYMAQITVGEKTAQVYFSVEAPEGPTPPPTADNNPMTLWVILMALSSMGLFVCLVLGKKRKNVQ